MVAGIGVGGIMSRAFQPELGGYVMGLIILIVLLVLVFGSVPRWSHSRNWGYGPSGVLGVILLIVLILFLMGRL
jgi:hypothetical protein